MKYKRREMTLIRVGYTRALMDLLIKDEDQGIDAEWIARTLSENRMYSDSTHMRDINVTKLIALAEDIERD